MESSVVPQCSPLAAIPHPSTAAVRDPPLHLQPRSNCMVLPAIRCRQRAALVTIGVKQASMATGKCRRLVVALRQRPIPK